MIRDPAPVIAAVAALIEASYQGGGFEEPLTRMATVLGGSNASLTLIAGGELSAARAVASNVGKQDQIAYAQRMDEDPRITQGIRIAAAQGGIGISRDEDIPGAGHYVRTALYREVLQPNDLHRSLGHADFRNSMMHIIMVINRSRRARQFDESHVRLFSTLTPMLATIARLSLEHDIRTSSRTRTPDAIEDRRGIRFLSTVALAKIRSADAIYVDREGLRHKHPSHDAALRRHVRAAIDGLRTVAVGNHTLSRVPLDRRHEVVVRSVRVVSADGDIEHRAEVFFEAANGASSLAAAWRLTRAERSVIESLASGYSVSEHAAAHGKSVHTVRNQLKSVLAKSGCRSQRQLLLAWLSQLGGREVLS